MGLTAIRGLLTSACGDSMPKRTIWVVHGRDPRPPQIRENTPTRKRAKKGAGEGNKKREMLKPTFGSFKVWTKLFWDERFFG